MWMVMVTMRETGSDSYVPTGRVTALVSILTLLVVAQWCC